MARMIDFSSFECDCGYQLHFFERTIREMCEVARRKRAKLMDGDDGHAVIFERGDSVAVYCPKTKAESPIVPLGSPLEANPPPKPRFTARQGQMLAFISLYTKLNRRPPSEADIAEYFKITPPSAHGMVVTLAKAGLIAREGGVSRSIRVMVEPAALPPLE